MITVQYFSNIDPRHGEEKTQNTAKYVLSCLRLTSGGGGGQARNYDLEYQHPVWQHLKYK